MGKHIILWLFCAVTVAIYAGPNGASAVADNPLNYTGGQNWWTIEQNQIYQQQQVQLQAARALAKQLEQQEDAQQLESLNAELNKAESNITIAQKHLDEIKANYLSARQSSPQDPWRLYQGNEIYLTIADDRAEIFSGKVQEVNSSGIRLVGRWQNKEQGIEYFLVNYPYKIVEGATIGDGNSLAAFRAGKFLYVSDEGMAKSLPKLDYGKVIQPLADAKSVIEKAQALSPDELANIKSAERLVSMAIATMLDCKTNLDVFVDKLNAESRRLEGNKNKALQSNIESASKGDAYGLLRMGERYRDGDGVEKDLVKAKSYLEKAAEAGSPTAAEEVKNIK